MMKAATDGTFVALLDDGYEAYSFVESAAEQGL